MERRADAARIVDGCNALLHEESVTRADLAALVAAEAAFARIARQRQFEFSM